MLRIARGGGLSHSCGNGVVSPKVGLQLYVHVYAPYFELLGLDTQVVL